MSFNNTRNTVRPAAHAIDYACASLGANVIATHLNRHIDDIPLIVERLKEVGQTQFINLTHRYDEGKIALALYAGDGIVTKIIPSDYFDKSEPVFSIPAITSETLNTEENRYLINTYPWLEPSPENNDTVRRMQAIIDDVGMRFQSGDGHPRNIHMMPDLRQTLAGIDSDMYHVNPDGDAATPELQNMWRDYIETMFPIYKTGEIPKQTDETDFRFLSIHDPDTGIAGFDASQDEAIIMADNRKPPTRSIWDMFSGPQLDL